MKKMQNRVFLAYLFLSTATGLRALGSPVFCEDIHGLPAPYTLLFSDSFEHGANGGKAPDSWWRRRGRLAWDPAVACRGRRSLRIDGVGEWGRSLGQGSARLFDPGTDFYVTVRMRADSAITARSIRLIVYTWDSRTKKPAGPHVESLRLGGSADDWMDLAVRVPGIANLPDSAWVGVSLVSTSPTGSVWFDDLRVLRPVPLEGRAIPLPPEKTIARRGRLDETDAVFLDNSWVRVAILPKPGGRIVEYRLKATQTNVLKSDTGYEEWLHTDGARRTPDLRKVVFKATLTEAANTATAILQAQAGPFDIRRMIRLGPYSKLHISTRVTNRDEHPHRVGLQTHPEFMMDDRTTGVVALVSRRNAPPLRLHASAWIRNPGRWSALYHEPSGVFLAKLYSAEFQPARVHVYWNDFFCNIEEHTNARLLAPGASFTAVVDYVLGRGLEPADVSPLGILGLRARPNPTGLEVQTALFSLLSGSAHTRCLLDDAAVGPKVLFSAVPMHLFRMTSVADSAALPAHGAAVRVECGDDRPADDLRATVRIDPNQARLASLLVDRKWQEWGRIRNIGYWYWFGRLWFFGNPNMQTLEDGYRVRVRDGGKAGFGVGWQWPKPLEPGYVYKFRLPFQGPPDFIAIDGHIVWEFGSGETDRGAAVFHYVPGSAGSGMIWCVRDPSNGLHTEQDPVGLPAALRRVSVAQAWRVPAPDALPRIAYPAWTAPRHAWRTPRAQADLESLYATPVPFDAPPLQKPKYPTDPVQIGAFLRDLWRLPGIYDLLCGNGVDGAWIGDGPLPPETVAAVQRQVRAGRLHWLGSWMCSQARYHTRPDWRTRVFNSGIQRANLVTGQSPDLDFYFMIPETQSVVFQGPQPRNDFERMARTVEVLRHWKNKRIWPLLEHPSRCRAVYNTDQALFPVAYYYQGGADLAMVKNIHRQNVEIVGANARGTGHAYGRPFALHYDTWNGIYVFSATPEELLHVFQLYYFYDADFIDHEGREFFVKTENGVQPTAPGVSLLRFARFVRRHPRRGRAVVRLAVMRGFGAGGHPYHQDLIACCSTGGGWSRPRSTADLDAVRDFDLLRVFLPKFGTCQRTELARFCTGTPYGPLDIVPWDAPASALDRYRVVVMMGLHGMSADQYTRLDTWVRRGGTLVCALGQFREPGDAPRRFIRADLATFPGAVPKSPEAENPIVGEVGMAPGENAKDNAPKDALPLRTFDCTPGKAAVVTEKTASGKPLILRVRHGRGRVFLSCTPFLVDSGEERSAAVIAEASSPSRMLDWAPATDWLEYVVHRKGESYAVALFNHGRLRFPTGFGVDHGNWEGNLMFRPGQWPGLDENADLAVFRVDPETFQLTPVPVDRTLDGVRIHLRVDRFAEFVIGPSATVRQDYFR